MRRASSRFAVVVSVCLTVLCTLLTAPATAADVAKRLPVQSVRGIAADAYGHLFVATDAGVLVTDLSGNRIKTISYNQVLDLSLSPDGGRLYLAERGNVALSVFDTKTLKQVARYKLPPGMCPVSVARTKSFLAFGFSCDTNQGGGVGFLSLANPTAKPVTITQRSFTYVPLVRAVPGTDRVVVATAWSGTVSVGIVTPGRVIKEGYLDSCANLRDLAVDPSGDSFVPACGWPYRFDRYDMQALAVSASYLARPYPNAVAFSRSGRTLVGGADGIYDPDVFVYPAGRSPRTPKELNGAGVTRGLTLSPDGRTIYAIAVKDGAYVLHTLPGERA